MKIDLLTITLSFICGFILYAEYRRYSSVVLIQQFRTGGLVQFLSQDTEEQFNREIVLALLT